MKLANILICLIIWIFHISNATLNLDCKSKSICGTNIPETCDDSATNFCDFNECIEGKKCTISKCCYYHLEIKKFLNSPILHSWKFFREINFTNT